MTKDELQALVSTSILRKGCEVGKRFSPECYLNSISSGKSKIEVRLSMEDGDDSKFDAHFIYPLQGNFRVSDIE